MAVKRSRVSSSAIRSIGHDKEKKRLEVEFRKSGSVYAYRGVSTRSANNLKNASSIGRHFVKNVRNDYPYERVRGGTGRRRVKKHR